MLKNQQPSTASLLQRCSDTTLHLKTFLFACGMIASLPTYACQWQSQIQAQNHFELNQQDFKENVPLPDKAKIGNITFNRLNVFNNQDPKERNWLFNLANQLHATTKEQTLSQQLLFKAGDDFNFQRLEESERLLRKTSYLYDVKIRPIQVCGPNVNIEVITREIWTLFPEISFSRNGGDNKSILGFRDTNFLGYGKRISINHSKDEQRSGFTFVYGDPNILGSRYQGTLQITDNDDGEDLLLDINRPFYSLDSRASHGSFFRRFKRIESLYYRNQKFSEFKQTTQQIRVFFGTSSGLEANQVSRLIWGLQNTEQRFEKIKQTTSPIAENRSLLYPYLAYQWLDNQFRELYNFDSIKRTEDINLGWDLSSLWGYSDKALSDDDNRLIFANRVEKAYLDKQQTRLFRFDASFNGYWNFEKQQLENAVLNSRIRINQHSSAIKSWYAALSISYTKNLTSDQQLLLGGESGLRGYPNRFQSGDRRFLFTLERRYYTDYHFLKLFHVGAALYFDMGRAWFAGRDNGTLGGALTNVGAGIRLVPSRSSSETVIHLDLAKPLKTDEGVDDIQWLITVRNSF